MAKMISKHATRVPGAIYRKLQSVIRARTTVYEAFQQIAGLSSKPDPEMEEKNVGHKYFIDALQEVFEVLGGPAWAQDQQSETRSQASRAKKKLNSTPNSTPTLKRPTFPRNLQHLALEFLRKTSLTQLPQTLATARSLMSQSQLPPGTSAAKLDQEEARRRRVASEPKRANRQPSLSPRHWNKFRLKATASLKTRTASSPIISWLSLLSSRRASTCGCT